MLVRIAASGINPGDVRKRQDAFGVEMPIRALFRTATAAAPDGATGPDAGAEAFNDRSAVAQYSFGAALQANLTGQLAGRRNELLVGAGLDAGRASYTLDTSPPRFPRTAAPAALAGCQVHVALVTAPRTASRPPMQQQLSHPTLDRMP